MFVVVDIHPTSARCRRISRDIRLWHTFCLNLVGQHAPLLHDMNSADYKQTYVTLCNKTPGEIYSFLMVC